MSLRLIPKIIWISTTEYSGKNTIAVKDISLKIIMMAMQK